MVPRDVAESPEEPEMNCNLKAGDRWRLYVEIKGQFCWWHVETIGTISEPGRNSQNTIPGTGEIVQCLTVLDVLTENLGLFPGTRMVAND